MFTNYKIGEIKNVPLEVLKVLKSRCASNCYEPPIQMGRKDEIFNKQFNRNMFIGNDSLSGEFSLTMRK